jgi:hypothetical protein
VGTRAWNLLTESKTLTDVCSILVDEYDVVPEVLLRDLTALVRDLCEKRLLVASDLTAR